MRLTSTTGMALGYLRGIYGLKQEDLARVAKMTPTALSLIETGKVAPRLDTLRNLVGFLGSSMKDLAMVEKLVKRRCRLRPHEPTRPRRR